VAFDAKLAVVDQLVSNKLWSTGSAWTGVSASHGKWRR